MKACDGVNVPPVPPPGLVHRLLLEAFADVPCPYPDENHDYSGAYWSGMREYLGHLSAAELAWHLPHVLLSFFDDPAKKFFEMVVATLDPARAAALGSVARKDAVCARDLAERRHRFDSYTLSQCTAVASWLLHTTTWDEYLFFPRVVDGALNYWALRAGWIEQGKS